MTDSVLIEFLTSSLGWSLIGFIFGFVLGRITLRLDEVVVQWVKKLKQNQGKTRDNS